jgi:hypothetical protein
MLLGIVETSKFVFESGQIHQILMTIGILIESLYTLEAIIPRHHVLKRESKGTSHIARSASKICAYGFTYIDLDSLPGNVRTNSHMDTAWKLSLSGWQRSRREVTKCILLPSICSVQAIAAK